jgi:hypothetical protein
MCLDVTVNVAMLMYGFQAGDRFCNVEPCLLFTQDVFTHQQRLHGTAMRVTISGELQEQVSSLDIGGFQHMVYKGHGLLAPSLVLQLHKDATQGGQCMHHEQSSADCCHMNNQRAWTQVHCNVPPLEQAFQITQRNYLAPAMMCNK